MFQLLIPVTLTGPASHLQKVCNNHQHEEIKPKCWHCQGDHLKQDCPTAPEQSSPQPKNKTTKEKQCNLIKTFCKRFQDRSQINEISAPSEDDSNDEFNKFFSEFESMMMEASDDSSA